MSESFSDVDVDLGASVGLGLLLITASSCLSNAANSGSDPSTSFDASCSDGGLEIGTAWSAVVGGRGLRASAVEPWAGGVSIVSFEGPEFHSQPISDCDQADRSPMSLWPTGRSDRI